MLKEFLGRTPLTKLWKYCDEIGIDKGQTKAELMELLKIYMSKNGYSNLHKFIKNTHYKNSIIFRIVKPIFSIQKSLSIPKKKFHIHNMKGSCGFIFQDNFVEKDNDIISKFSQVLPLLRIDVKKIFLGPFKIPNIRSESTFRIQSLSDDIYLIPICLDPLECSWPNSYTLLINEKEILHSSNGPLKLSKNIGIRTGINRLIFFHNQIDSTFTYVISKAQQLTINEFENETVRNKPSMKNSIEIFKRKLSLNSLPYPILNEDISKIKIPEIGRAHV